MRESENSTVKKPGCADIRPLLIDHLRGESGRRREVIERHLASCEECRRWAGFIRALEHATRSGEAGGRLGFERRLEGVLATAAVEADSRRAGRRFVLRITAAAALFVALFGGLLPPVQEAALWIGRGIATYPLHVLAAAAGLLLLSSPLLFITARGRMEDVS